MSITLDKYIVEVNGGGTGCHAVANMLGTIVEFLTRKPCAQDGAVALTLRMFAADLGGDT